MPTHLCGGVTVPGTTPIHQLPGSPLVSRAANVHLTLYPVPTPPSSGLRPPLLPRSSNPAVLTVTANNQTKAYDTANPT